MHILGIKSCKPILSKGTSLSLEKIASIFVIFFTTVLVSLATFITEKITSCYSLRKSSKNSKKDQEEFINTQIAKFINELKKESDDKTTGVCQIEIKKAIHLLNESKQYLSK